jgi:hypothetical protein
MQSLLNAFEYDHKGTAEGNLANILFKAGIDSNTILMLSPALRQYLQNGMHVDSDTALIAIGSAINKQWKELNIALSKRTLYTIGFNSVYDFINHRYQEMSLTPINLIVYGFKQWKRSPSLSFKGDYLFDEDSLTKKNFKRNLVRTNLGIDFIICVNDDLKPTFEIKPGLKSTFVTKNKYIGEKTSMWDPTVTFSIRISDNFYVPIQFEYDTTNPQLFGFLSVQYSFD